MDHTEHYEQVLIMIFVCYLIELSKHWLSQSGFAMMSYKHRKHCAIFIGLNPGADYYKVLDEWWLLLPCLQTSIITTKALL